MSSQKKISCFMLLCGCFLGITTAIPKGMMSFSERELRKYKKSQKADSKDTCEKELAGATKELAQCEAARSKTSHPTPNPTTPLPTRKPIGGGLGDSTPTVFSFKGYFETYVVPQNGLYKLTAIGASGGTGTPVGATPSIGGKGAYMEGYYKLWAGDTLTVSVGGKGADSYSLDKGTSNCGGGGGASAIVYNKPGGPSDSAYDDLLLIMAGGGGGGCGVPSGPSGNVNDASLTNSGFGGGCCNNLSGSGCGTCNQCDSSKADQYAPGLPLEVITCDSNNSGCHGVLGYGGGGGNFWGGGAGGAGYYGDGQSHCGNDCSSLKDCVENNVLSYGGQAYKSGNSGGCCAANVYCRSNGCNLSKNSNFWIGGCGGWGGGGQGGEYGGGGGGGYSGGGGGNVGSTCDKYVDGGGGGSYNGCSNQNNYVYQLGADLGGNGSVMIAFQSPL